MNLTEDYCSFELSKLLKEKGFDEPCFSYYKNDKSVHWFEYRMRNSQTLGRYIMRPYYGLAMKWLREKGYHIVVFTDSPRYKVKIQDLNDGSFNVSSITHTYDTYEEAVEAAIKYSLENLI